MSLNSIKLIPALSFILALLLLASCGPAGIGRKTGGREAAIGEHFKMIPDEKVSIKDTTLTLELKTVRRTWYVDGKSETADADIIITLDAKEQRQWIDIGERVMIGDYMVELSGANPFGKTDAELSVTRR